MRTARLQQHKRVYMSPRRSTLQVTTITTYLTQQPFTSSKPTYSSKFPLQPHLPTTDFTMGYTFLSALAILAGIASAIPINIRQQAGDSSNKGSPNIGPLGLGWIGLALAVLVVVVAIVTWWCVRSRRNRLAKERNLNEQWPQPRPTRNRARSNKSKIPKPVQLQDRNRSHGVYRRETTPEQAENVMLS